jgi:hypothetical protein
MYSWLRGLLAYIGVLEHEADGSLCFLSGDIIPYYN